tara:strand:+ start:700 stop:1071 length:372 start_codon:yes stop_codon:yes gene_type:complete
MALTNLDKDTSTRLFQMLSLTDSSNNINIIKSNYSTYGQLKIIADQIINLQNKAKEIIINAEINDKLHNIEMNCKKVPGTYYYHYEVNNKEILSIISPDECNFYTKYYGKYIFNYDNLFYKID